MSTHTDFINRIRLEASEAHKQINDIASNAIDNVSDSSGTLYSAGQKQIQRARKHVERHKLPYTISITSAVVLVIASVSFFTFWKNKDTK